MERETLLAEITEYAARAGWKPSTVCLRAVGNGHLYRRMKEGGDCTTDVAARLRQYMTANPPADRATGDAA